MKKDLLKLLDNVQENNVEAPQPERYMLIDGLNLFFRNFSIINAVNSNGAHIGGLGGFFRSLGALTRQIQPTQIIVVFDGVGSSNNRKNIIPEYKSNRNLTRVTKHELFDNIDEEDDAKVSQIVRIIEYLQTLPVKVISLDRVEADDIIAHLSSVLPQKEDEKVFIVSSDKDYLQLVSKQVIVYRPIEKEFFTESVVKEKFGLDPHNFILMKTLLGDASDALPGIKGLGPKTLFKKFPELTNEHLSFDDIIDISEKRMEEHVVYARILHDIEMLENKYKIMDLSNPMMTDEDKEYIAEFIQPYPLELHAKEFINMYNEDQLGGLIRNVEFWVKDIFQNLVTSK
jgi:5'-3' exonuclease